MSSLVSDKRAFVREMEAVLSFWEHNQSVISVAHALLLSRGPLEEWTFCTAAYVAAITFLTEAHTHLCLQMCAWIKRDFFFFLALGFI